MVSVAVSVRARALFRRPNNRNPSSTLLFFNLIEPGITAPCCSAALAAARRMLVAVSIACCSTAFVASLVLFLAGPETETTPLRGSASRSQRAASSGIPSFRVAYIKSS